MQILSPQCEINRNHHPLCKPKLCLNDHLHLCRLETKTAVMIEQNLPGMGNIFKHLLDTCKHDCSLKDFFLLIENPKMATTMRQSDWKSKMATTMRQSDWKSKMATTMRKSYCKSKIATTMRLSDSKS